MNSLIKIMVSAYMDKMAYLFSYNLYHVLIKEAFAIVLWFLFCIILYYIIFANNVFKTRTYYEKNNF